MLISRSKTVALAAVLCISTLHTAFSADSLPAVSKPNLTVGLEGGRFDGEEGFILNGSASAPVGHRYGVQLDALIGDGNHFASGVGGHFFYRDPATYLLGLTAMHSDYSETQFQRYGVESELYLGNFTVAPAIGFQNGDSTLGNSGYYTLDGSYYPLDTVKLTLGSTGYSDVRAGYGVAEWQPDLERPLTVYGYAGGATEGDAFAMAGVRYTFGSTEDSSIKQRDRTGDPSNIVKTAISYVGSAFSQVYGPGGFGNNLK